ncbi:MAG: cytosolic protein [Candidatus Komeilibacteria bacterium CG_4_9_14_0_8_um_filter_36_9]|uniref:Cytosolic protein n=1 Tax=Candidatus Komeilibacteria bacterium CG_4_9_14_0_8_um_filter_36_9 TaxID=1974473 RepID=A0A2M8DQC8_9BACT|nr:MAG: cytosolic protein [Candidatus Komeilibacteria bacterium CG_4_9_14_0_8_um_filter_36_9]
MECKQAKNCVSCNCTYGNCPRQGLCCECLQYHLANKELPACCFSNKTEATYDRSFVRFIKDNSR